MAREPEEEETVRTAALVRRCPHCSCWSGAPRQPLWLLCLVTCWILGPVADADFSILDEAQVLASQMRRLAAEELGVVTMQVSDPLGAVSLAVLSRCAEPRGSARDALGGCRTPTPSLQQTPPHRVLSVPQTFCPAPAFPFSLAPAPFMLPEDPVLCLHLPAPPPRVCTLFHCRFVFTRHSCKLPLPLCVPIPRQRVPPGWGIPQGLPLCPPLKPPSILENLAYGWARKGRESVRRTAGIRAAHSPCPAALRGGKRLARRIPRSSPSRTDSVAFCSCGPRSRAVCCVIFGLCVPLLGRTR